MRGYGNKFNLQKNREIQKGKIKLLAAINSEVYLKSQDAASIVEQNKNFGVKDTWNRIELMNIETLVIDIFVASFTKRSKIDLKEDLTKPCIG